MFLNNSKFFFKLTVKWATGATGTGQAVLLIAIGINDTIIRLIQRFILVRPKPQWTVRLSGFIWIDIETGVMRKRSYTAFSLSLTNDFQMTIEFLVNRMCCIFLCAQTAFIGDREIWWVSNYELLESFVATDIEPAFFTPCVAPPFNGALTARITIQQDFQRFIFPLKTMAL